MKSEINFKNVWSYFVGNYRYSLKTCSTLNETPLIYMLLVRRHIREQIDIRVRSMNLDCYRNGACTACGCKTTQLQMASKSCDGNCYPKMMNKSKWRKFMKTCLIDKKHGAFIKSFNKEGWAYSKVSERFVNINH